MNTIQNKALHWFIVSTFIGLYLIVSIISTIHVIDFFKLSNPEWLAISLAISFEIGAAASLASLIVLDKMNKPLVWGLFISLTLMQMMGNMYFSFMHLQDFTGWVELFGLVEEDVVYQKRVLSIISGAILPLIALGFIKSLVDYINPSASKETAEDKETVKYPAKPNIATEPMGSINLPKVAIEDALDIQVPAANESPAIFTQRNAVNYAKNLDPAKTVENTENDKINSKVRKATPSSRDPAKNINPQIRPGVN